ncbi:chemotaxis protein CheW [Aphanothece hegewaldii CCALA 016]|uniref:Chemotaxis protein CheW n=1 Tax=Aphanothece hegewaldii CCALA 016 TaxID=2107694 RepID=A0A2T1LV00_9CHRO|nr:chemotaxis protein CheW [Aphanothece hegewaldii]PSF35281.1 chemotaxis protein CheW [Aphanothece hegewaldii CCALA 016]
MEKNIEDCWNKIGVSGDSSCSLLPEVIHCRNCSVYAAAGRTLLHRESPVGYIEEWTHLVSQPLPKRAKKYTETTTFSQKIEHKLDLSCVLIFRLETEWFALPIGVIKEVTSLCTVHTLPHRSNDILLGVVNIRGEILICVSLSNLLQLKPVAWKNSSLSKNNASPKTYQRMVVTEIQDNRWVFIVDEIYSVQRLKTDDLSNVPTVITKTPDTYTQKIIQLEDKKINFVDSEMLFYELLFYTFSRP